MKYFNSIVEAAKAFGSSDKGRENQDDSFWICDLGEAASLLEDWSQKLPGVRPFYAMKSAPHPGIMKVLLIEGAGIDCASQGEMKVALKLGAKPEDIIFSNTNKQISHLQFARRKNINLTVYDGEEELRKIHAHHPQTKLLLRMKGLVEAASRMSERFGANLKNAKRLLRLSNELGLRTVGISFHVGTACREAKAYEYAIDEAKKLLVYANRIGINCEMLNIGGGFEGTKHAEEYFEENAAVVRDKIQSILSDSRFSQLQVVAEPGRYFAEKCFSLVANVIAKKEDEDIIHYTLNEGVCTSFFCTIAGREHGEKRDMLPLNAISKQDADDRRSRLYGPASASFDLIKELNMAELDVGDWLMWKECGAYSFAFGGEFNGFRTGVIYDIATERNRKHLSKESLQYIANRSKYHN